MHVPRVIAVGGSAGSLEPFVELLRALGPDVPAPVLIVSHVSPESPSVLPAILARKAAIPVEEARDGEALADGRAYVARPDRHLILRNRTLHLSRGPRENRHRPAIDPLFRSAARFFGVGAVGVVLSGTLDDGTAGLLAIHRAGGTSVVQSPDDALYTAMPTSAIVHVPVDFQVPARELGALLDRIVRSPAKAGPEAMPPIEHPRRGRKGALRPGPQRTIRTQ